MNDNDGRRLEEFSKKQTLIHLMGLHPFVAFSMLAVDWMLFAGEGATSGISWLVSAGVALALSIPCVLIQRYGDKDEWGLAIGKGMMVGILTAIPTALPSVVTAAGGVLGITGRALRRRALLDE
jgi:hypothetical protein